ncbi:MAG: MarC family protein [Ignavibacteria bacterium]|nr:MarC family protein [Ignavibacteria bacterium]
MDLQVFLLTFIPMFVAIDSLGIVPLYLGLTEKVSPLEKNKLVLKATLTAFVICVAFLYIGNALFNFLGITVNDFRIAGGIILLIISINDLLFYSSRVRDVQPDDVGVVPLGIPLIAGPAVLTTMLILMNESGKTYVIISLVLNLLINYFALRYADLVKRILRDAGSKAFAKVASLFLAAIAVMMIRVGIMNSIK